MYTAVVVSIILAIIIITFAGWKIKKNSNKEISTRGYAKVTKFYRDYSSMRRDIRETLKDDKITYKELKELKAKYREAAKKKMK
jgi:FtsZ-interacting cell division protein ZipA